MAFFVDSGIYYFPGVPTANVPSISKKKYFFFMISPQNEVYHISCQFDQFFQKSIIKKLGNPSFKQMNDLFQSRNYTDYLFS